ncbi:hypothetical protein GCM10027168_60330 [Streptomyces capparidis]
MTRTAADPAPAADPRAGPAAVLGAGPGPVPGPAAHVPAGPGAVHAWWADGRGLPAAAVAELAAGLPEPERGRYDGVSDPLGRAEFALARSVLRRALGRVLGCPPARVRLTAEPSGRPRVEGEPGVDVSIAHTAGLVVVAVGTGLAPGTRVGVDVERVRPVPRAGELARRLFSAAERARLDTVAGPAADRAWLEIWTRREAYAKALGTGVRAVADAPEQHTGHAWHPLRLPDGFTGGLVVVPPAGPAGPSPVPPPPSPNQGALP